MGGGPVEFPAAYDSVIAVTATDTFDMPGYFSPMGEELELAAPGVDVLSTVAEGGYDSLSGTSQAVPHVTGAAALYLLSNTEDLNGDGEVNQEDVRSLLQLTATDLGDVGKDDVYGYGLVNAAGVGNFAPRPAGRPLTKFEQRGQRLGHGVWDLLFERRSEEGGDDVVEEAPAQ